MAITPIPEIPPHLRILEGEVKKETLIEKGSYGSVFRGRWQEITVAIKVAPLANLQDAQIRLTFMREIETMQRAAHPRIIRLYGVYLDNDNYNLVMEYVSSSLNSILKNKNPPLWPSRIRMAIDIGRGLKFLHEHQILHRDLKSPNILVDNLFHAKICDFGQSKFYDTNKQTTATLAKTGTPKWKAPEHIESNLPSKESDIFSYGVILWELASCKEPYEQLLNDQALSQIVLGRLEPLPTDGLRPKQYDKIVDSARNIKPQNRATVYEIIVRVHGGMGGGYF